MMILSDLEQSTCKKRINQNHKRIIKKCPSLKSEYVARHRKKFELRHLSAADKELTAYRYFENRVYPKISKLLFIDITTIRGELNKIILGVGRKVYGLEQEFWNAIHRESYYKDLEEMFYNRIVREVKRKLTEEFPDLELILILSIKALFSILFHDFNKLYFSVVYSFFIWYLVHVDKIYTEAELKKHNKDDMISIFMTMQKLVENLSLTCAEQKIQLEQLRISKLSNLVVLQKR